MMLRGLQSGKGLSGAGILPLSSVIRRHSFLKYFIVKQESEGILHWHKDILFKCFNFLFYILHWHCLFPNGNSMQFTQ
jgi:hypothetical protein